MNALYGMELQYESLIPIERPEDTFLSVDTVTLLVEGRELRLDFNITEGNIEGEAGSIIRLNVLIKEFEPESFMFEYQELGLDPADFTYDFFAARHFDTFIKEVYTDYYYKEDETYLPLTLKSACLLFEDGSTIDYSDRISAIAQRQLAEVEDE